MKRVAAGAGLLFAVVGLCFCLISAGCGGAPTQDNAARSSSNLRTLALAAITYKTEKGAWPDSLEQVKGAPGVDFASILKNPLTGDDPGYEYVKPAQDEKPAPPGEESGYLFRAPGKNDAQTVILYQLRKGSRDTKLPVAYADGSVKPLDKQ